MGKLFGCLSLALAGILVGLLFLALVAMASVVQAIPFPVVREMALEWLVKTEATPVAPVFAAPPPSTLPQTSREEILARARGYLGVGYLWGGTGRYGIDCSAYVSLVAWGTGRYTTDTIGAIARLIPKEDLQPGDALNLPTWADLPRRYGHMRLFAGWANPQHTRFWTYEATADQNLGVVYRQVPYDERYTPLRYKGLKEEA